MPKFGNKSALFGYFCARILKNFCRIWNQNPQISLFAKSLEKLKIPKVGTKSSLFGYFCARILKKLLSFLKWAPSNLSISKILPKKMPKFGSKSVLFYVFLGYNFKKLFSYLKSAPSNLSISKILRRKKCWNFGTKVPYLAIFTLEF